MADWRKRMVAALDNPHPLAALRAAEEVTYMGEMDENARRALLAVLHKVKVANKPQVKLSQFREAAAAYPKIVPDIIDLLKGTDTLNEEQLDVYLAILGRIGPPAKEAVPFLEAKLEDPALMPGTKGSIRVVIANICGGPDDNLKAITDDLKVPADEATKDVRGRVLAIKAMLAKARPGTWVNEGIINELAKDFDEDKLKKSQPTRDHVYRGLLNSTLVLGMLGEEAQAAAGRLEAFQKSAIANGSIMTVPFTLALARIDAKNQDAALRRLFKNLPRAFREPEGAEHLLLPEDIRPLVDAKLSTKLAEMLSDRDRQVAEGAATLLWWSGLAARDALPVVLKYVDSNADPERSRVSCEGSCENNPCDRLSDIEAVLKREKNDQVRNRLKSAIKTIRNLDKILARHEDLLRPPLQLIHVQED